MVRTIAFWSAVVGSALLLMTIIAGGAAWPAYSHVRDFISELGSSGAPHGRLVNMAGFLPVGILLTLFTVLAAFTTPRGRLWVAGFACLSLFTLSYALIAFFPCDLGCPPTSPSLSQMMHNLFGLLGYVGAPVGLAMLAVAARKRPGAGGLFPLGLICAAVSAAAFVVMLFEPPVGGVVQRLLEGAIVVWILACAFTLRRKTASV